MVFSIICISILLLSCIVASIPSPNTVVTWGNWTACSKTCGGGGKQTRTKFCDIGSGPIACETVNNACGIIRCNRKFAGATWTECSKTCGGGTRSRVSLNGKFTQTIDCHSQPCKLVNNCPTDLILVLDASGSIRELNFWKQKQFVIDFLLTLVISKKETKIGAITFSSKSVSNFGLDTYDDIQLIIDHIWRIQYYSRGTNTASGIKTMNLMMNAQKRSEVSQVSIVITDGSSNIDKKNTIPNANLAKADNIVMVALGIANYNLVELKGIATSDDTVATVSSFNSLNTIISTITDITCNIAKTVDCTQCEFSQGLFWQPDLHNCHMYYVCVPLVNGKYNPISMNCGALYWNQAIRNCLPYPDASSTCNLKVTAIPTLPTITTPPGPCVYVANAKDPSLFSTNGLAPFQSCGKNGVFNSATGVCTCEYKSQSKCDDSMLLHFPFDSHLNDVTCMKALSQKLGAGTVTLVTDASRGKVASFNGAYLDVPFLRSYFGGDHINAFSICLYYKYTTVNGKTDVLVSNGNCHENASFEIGISSKAIYGDVNTSSGSSGHTTASNVSPGVWNHVCWVFNGSDLVLYINKIAQASVTATGYMMDTNVPMAIGARCGKNKFTGLIDEVQVYAYALTAMQVSKL